MKQRAVHEQIVEKVHLIEQLNIRMANAKNSAAKKSIERTALSTEKDLSALIDGLYGVEELQVAVADESN